MTNEEIQKVAEEFAKKNKEKIAKELTDPAIFIPDAMPVSAFMAGSPGAGKTEFSKFLIQLLEKQRNHKVVRIDGDDARSLLPQYTGTNSYLFQYAITLIVEKIHDLALHNKQTFVLDGTLSNFDKAVVNINRSLTKQRPVLIFYIYQKPDVAWKFTLAREEKEGRNIPKKEFIRQFLDARDTVDKLRKHFGANVAIFLVKKDFRTHTVEDIMDIEKTGKQIDDYIPERYTEDELNASL